MDAHLVVILALAAVLTMYLVGLIATEGRDPGLVNGGAPTLTFYSLPGCPHCVRARAEWDEFAATYDGPVILRVIDAGPESEALGVTRFPTFLFATTGYGDDRDLVEYVGPRTSEGFASLLRAPSA